MKNEKKVVDEKIKLQIYRAWAESLHGRNFNFKTSSIPRYKDPWNIADGYSLSKEEVIGILEEYENEFKIRFIDSFVPVSNYPSVEFQRYNEFLKHNDFDDKLNFFFQRKINMVYCQIVDYRKKLCFEWLDYIVNGEIEKIPDYIERKRVIKDYQSLLDNPDDVISIIYEDFCKEFKLGKYKVTRGRLFDMSLNPINE